MTNHSFATPTIPTPTPSVRKPWSASWSCPFPARLNANSCGTTTLSSTEFARLTVAVCYAASMAQVELRTRIPHPSSWMRLMAADHANVEMPCAQCAPQPQPEREKHFCSARGADVAEVNDVCLFPAEPFTESVADFAFGLRIIAAEKQVVVTRHERRLHHDVAVHRVERLHYARVGEPALHLFAERIGVADSQRRRHACRHVERIGDFNENFPAQIGRTCLTQRHKRMRAIGAVEDDVAERRGLGERAALRLAADGT